MAIYTRNGDDGSSAGADGQRVSKGHPSMRVQGDLDELTAQVGLCLAGAHSPEGRRVAVGLDGVQNELMVIGGMLSGGAGAGERLGTDRLEQIIDAAEDELEPSRTFILPGGCELACRLHIARTVCRRAERGAAGWADAGGTIASEVLAYINRLGDVLFALARLANRDAGTAETPWPDTGVRR